MKKICALFLAALMLLSMLPTVSASGTPAAATAQAMKGTPTIDGDLSEWADCESYEMTKRPVDGTAETTGWFKMMWDESAIYIGGQITDATYDTNDMFKFLLDFDGHPEATDTLGSRTHSGVYSYMLWGHWFNGNAQDPGPYNAINAYRGDSYPCGNDVLGDGVSYNSMAYPYANGAYTFEICLVPTAEMKAKLTGNAKIGFDFQWIDLNGADSADNAKHTTIGWASDEASWQDDLSKVGEVTLVSDEEPPVDPPAVAAAQAMNGTPIIDGDLTEWADCESYEMTKRPVDGTAETTGWFKLMWDENALYIGGQIADATKEDSDIFKVLLDFDGHPEASDTLGSRTNSGVYSYMMWGYWFNDNNAQNPAPFNAINGYYGNGYPSGNDVLGNGSDYNSVYTVYADGAYTFEICLIPTAEMKANLTDNAKIGFDIQWVDLNGAGSGEDIKNTTIGWASDEASWQDDLSKVGEVTLVSEEEPPVDPPVVATAQAMKGTPTIDGSLTEWENCESYEMTKRPVDGTAETTGWFKLMWDENALYIGGQITDATNTTDDMIKFLLDFDGHPEATDTLGSRTNAGVYSYMLWGYWFNNNDPKNPAPFNAINAYRSDSLPCGNDILGNDSDYNSIYTSYADGAYTFEICLIPTAEMKAKLTNNAKIGFDIEWIDFNGAGSADDIKHTTIGWASDEANWQDDLSKVGEVELMMQSAPSDTQFVSYDDDSLTYLGRWLEKDGYTESYWTTPSVTFDFTGDCLYLELAKKSSIAVELDGVVTDYNAAEGVMKIDVTGEGPHTVRVYGPGMNLKGFYVAQDAAVTKTAEKDYYAIFIGDSISEDHRSGTFNSARLAGWDWTVYALGGLALSDDLDGYYNNNATGWGYYNNGYYETEPMAGWDGSRIGMQSAFFNYERPIDKISDYTPYDGFSEERQPDAVFVALGVNDTLTTQARSDIFVEDYIAFVEDLRACYPDATIYIVQALNDGSAPYRQSAISEAAAAACSNDSNVVFLSETTQWGVEISSDNTHPTQTGYETITEKLAELLIAFAENGGPSVDEVPAGQAEYGYVTVDGQLTEWSSSEKYTLAQRPVDGEAQTTGWYQIKWNEQGLYIGGQITDATLDTGNDGVKILMDFDGRPENVTNFADRLLAGVYSWMTWGYTGPGSTPENQLPYNPCNAYGYTLPAGSSIVGDGVTQNQFAWNYADGAYTFELNIVAGEAVKDRLTAGTEIGFDIQWLDFNDATSDSDTKLTTIGWASDLMNWNEDLSRIGKIVLLEKKTVPAQASLTLNSVLGVNFKIEGDYTVKVAVGDEPAQEIAGVDGTYTANVYAADMMKPITAEIYEAGCTVPITTKVFNITDYVAAILSMDDVSQETKDLAEATLTVCQYAAYLVGNYSGTLNALEEIPANAFAAYAPQITGSIPGVYMYACVTEAAQLRLCLPAEYADCTVTIDGEAVTGVLQDDGTYYYASQALLPQDYDIFQNFIVTRGGETLLECNYGMLSYLGNVISRNDNTESMQNLLTAMYHYWAAADIAAK